MNPNNKPGDPLDVEYVRKDEVEALKKRITEVERRVKFWDKEAARFCHNEPFYRDPIVSEGDLGW